MKIMILHLSDIHIGSTDWIIASSSKICKAVEDIAADCEYTFVVISGDLAATGIPGEYVKVLSLLENIAKGFKNPPISKDIVIITVPGNHDCNFTKVDSQRSELLEKIKFIPSEDIDINTVNQCASVQADYFDFAASIGNNWDKQKLGYVMTIKLANYQLTFNCYNTAWMFIRDQLPASCIFPVTCANRHINSIISNLNISLLHHPLEWFNPDNRRIFKGYLTGISDLVLTGHEHQMGKRIEDNLEGKITLYIEGGELQDQKDIDNSGFISLVVETSTSIYRIMQYKWNGSVFKLVQENKWAPNGGKTLGRKSMNPCSISSLCQERLNSLDAPIFHPNKSGVLKLDDVYIFPDLRDLEEKESNIETKRRYFDSSQFATQISDTQKVFILGEAKSGKTSLCKNLYQKYHICGYVPVYINANEIQHSSLEAFDKLLSLSFKKQYNLIETDDFADVASNKQVLFIDDFEKATLPSEDLASLLDKINTKYTKVFIFANSIFELEDLIAKNSRLFLALNDYRMFSILQFGFELRHKLIYKWNRIGINRYEEEELVRKDDEYEQKMNILLGDGSIVTPYPIFLLTILLAIETGNTQNLETSSYSHYYQFIISQALVALHLSNADLDSYYSFLTNLAKHLFLSRSRVISKQDLADFHSEFVLYYRVSPYSGMVYQFDKLKDNLCNADIFEEHKGSFSFKQGFVYYYFVGKFLSENRTSEQEKETILNLIKDIQYEEYANILMFLIHHTKEDYILRAMIDHAKSIFAQSKPLKLESDTSYIADLLEEVPTAVLKKIGIQEYRIEKSRQKDSAKPPKDKTQALRDKEIPPQTGDDPTAIGFVTNLVIASRLIGLMGQILLDYRSIPGDTQEEIAEEVYLLSLRSLGGLFELLEKQNDKIIDNITKRIIADGISDESNIKRQAKIILFNIYHILAYSLIKIVSDSIGSDTLSAVVVNIPRKYPYLSVALIDMSAKLDHYRGFPEGELVNFIRTISIPSKPIHSSFIKGRLKSGPQIQKSRILPFTLLRQLVEEYLYKFHTNYQERQKISSITGIEIQEQLMIGQTSQEKTEKQNE